LNEPLRILEDFILTRGWSKHTVEVVVLHAVFDMAHSEGGLIIDVETRDELLGVLLLSPRERPNPTVDTNLALGVFKLIKQAFSLDLFLLVLG